MAKANRTFAAHTPGNCPVCAGKYTKIDYEKSLKAAIEEIKEIKK